MLDGLMSDYPFLKMLDEEALAIIERNLVQKKVQAGELLINGEEACWGFSFIKSGVLRVYRLNDEGREVTLYRLRKGDSCFMTVICALTQNNTHAYVRVEEDSELVILPMLLFEKYLMNHPVYLQFVFKNLYEKFLSVIQVVENVTFNSIEQRVIDYLQQLSRGGLLYRTHEQIAFDIGSTREVVSRTLKSLE
ncbi:DNA-binding transcriptional dual regulator Crp [Turicibacter sanguinis]|nr:DNA-binding transcriptional dual regulator Crp [Turicibacter sanguinis]